MLSIDGTVVEGLRAASGFTIAAQMPTFEKEIPGIAGIHYGTINLRLESQLRVTVPIVNLFVYGAARLEKCLAFSK